MEKFQVFFFYFDTNCSKIHPFPLGLFDNSVSDITRHFVYHLHGMSISLLLAAFSGFLYSVSLPNELLPFGSPLIGPIALIPVFLAILRVRSIRHAAAVGVVFGVVSTLLSNYWLMFFGEFSVWTIGGVTVGYAAYNALFFPFLWVLSAPNASLTTVLPSRDRVLPYRPVLIASAWVAYELLKSRGFLAYPWGLAAYTASSVPSLIQSGELFGVWGLSFIVIFLNASILELMSAPGTGLPDPEERRRALRYVASALALTVVLAGFGVVRLHQEVPIVGEFTAVLIQPNTDSWETGNEESSLLILQNLTRDAIIEHGRPDIVVWSETSLRRPYPENQDFFGRFPARDPFTQFLREIDTPLVTGAPWRVAPDSHDYMNAVIMIKPNGTVSEWYGKQQLVPFAEGIPFWEFGFVRRFFRSVVGIFGVWTPGNESRLFGFSADGHEYSFSAPICFEDAFANVVRRFDHAGADLHVNLTNNSWSRTDSAQYQHFVAALFRTVETRRTLVRSTNSGFTVVLDAHGRTVDSLPMFTSAYLHVTVPVHALSRRTVYSATGDVLPISFFILITVFLIARIRTRGRRLRLERADDAAGD